MEEQKAQLIKTYSETQRQVSSVKLLLDKKLAECNEVQKKMKLATETWSLAQKVDLKSLEQTMQDYEMLVLKAETLAARENSSQNSTPEAREINNKIEQTFDEVYKIEAIITQSKLDLSTYQQDIETIERERVEKREQSSNKITSIYKNIQNLREEVSQYRQTNLANLTQVQNEELGKEIDIQVLSTMGMLYSEFTNQSNAVLQKFKNQEPVDELIKAEIEKCKTLESKIPVPKSSTSYEQIEEMRNKTEILLQQINSFEDKIKSSIQEMMKEEERQDSLANTFKKEQHTSNELMEKLRQQDSNVKHLEQKIQHLKEKDATKKDVALAELEKLKIAIIELTTQNRKRWEQINQLRNGSTARLKFNTPIDNLCMKIRSQTEEMEAEIERLSDEENDLKAQLAKTTLE